MVLVCIAVLVGVVMELPFVVVVTVIVSVVVWISDVVVVAVVLAVVLVLVPGLLQTAVRSERPLPGSNIFQ